MYAFHLLNRVMGILKAQPVRELTERYKSTNMAANSIFMH